MKIFHLATTETGGAGSAALRTVSAQCAAGLDSTLGVRWKRTNAPNVRSLSFSAHLGDRVRRWYRRHSIRKEVSRFRNDRGTQFNIELFSSDRSDIGRQIVDAIPKDVDLLHIHWVAGLLDYEAALPILARRFPIVWTLHDLNPLLGGTHYKEANLPELRLGEPWIDEIDPISRNIIRRKMSAFVSLPDDAVTFTSPSNWIDQEIASTPSLKNFSRHVVPYAIDTETFRRFDSETARALYGVPQDSFCIAASADYWHNDRKGIDILISALASLMSDSAAVHLNHIHLLLIGSSGDQFAERIPSSRISPTGHICSEPAMAVALSAADCFVIPSRQDNLPNVVLEAMAAGLPVLGSDVGGIPDMIDDPTTGLLFPVGDLALLQQQIIQLINEPSLAESMGKSARNRIQKYFTPKIHVDRLNSVYESAIARHSR